MPGPETIYPRLLTQDTRRYRQCDDTVQLDDPSRLASAIDELEGDYVPVTCDVHEYSDAL